MTTSDDDFCPDCGVTLDLHDGEDSCDNAAAKVDLLARFMGVGGTKR